MAYNRTFNPDALPAFAEPDRKPPAGQQTTVHPPRGSSQSHSPPQNEQYSNKPPPPLPRQDNNSLRSNSYEGSGQRRQPSPDYRSNSYGGSGLGKQQAPLTQPQGNYAYSSSPPSNNGRFLPPQNAQSRPPPAASRPPASPAPGGSNADPSLLPLFRAVDKNGEPVSIVRQLSASQPICTGQLTEKQLGAALVNGDWSSFDPHTVQLMIRMFDTDGSGTIGFEEFCGLWSFLASWRTLFDRFDVDCSGNISLDEFTNALTAFGYRLSPEFVRFLFGQYDKHRSNQLSFDLFVQSCISLKRMTDVFKRYDDDRDGFIQLSFEDFLMEILRQR